MVRKDRTINAWQAGILTCVLLFANKILILPSLLYEDTKMEAVFVPFVLFAFELGLVFLFFKLKSKFPNCSFATLLQNLCGKWLSILIYGLIMLFFLGKAVLLYNVTYMFFKNVIYIDTGTLPYLLCIVVVINHLAVCGLRALGRTLQLFFPAILAVTLFSIIVGASGIEAMPLFFTSTAKSFVFSCLRHISAFGDSIFLFVFFDRIEIKKGQWKSFFALTGFGMVCVSAIIVISLVIYCYTAFLHPFAFFELMSYIKEYGGLGRIDILSMIVLIAFTYFHMAIYMKIFTSSFDTIFPKIKSIYGVLVFDFAFVLIVNFVVKNLSKTIVYGESYLPLFSIVAFVILPAVVVWLLLSKKNGEFEAEKFSFERKNRGKKVAENDEMRRGM